MLIDKELWSPFTFWRICIACSKPKNNQKSRDECPIKKDSEVKGFPSLPRSISHNITGTGRCQSQLKAPSGDLKTQSIVPEKLFLPGGGGGGGSVTHECATHLRPPTCKMNPKWRIAPYVTFPTLNGVNWYDTENYPSVKCNFE